MPKPYIVHKPSGRYVRWLIPTDLRPILGARFIVRRIRTPTPDLARLFVAGLSVTLSLAFEAIREGEAMPDVKTLLDSAEKALKTGKAKEWTAELIKVGNKVEFRNVKTDGSEDTDDFIRTKKIIEKEEEPKAMLADEITKHLLDLVRLKRSNDTLLESTHTLKILLGVIGDIDIKQINADHIRVFWDGVRWWPRNASKLRKYKGLSVKEIIECGKQEKVDGPAPYTLIKHRQRLAVFFNDLFDQDLLNKSPLAKRAMNISVDDEESGRPFTDEELKKIFGSTFEPWAKKSPHRWFGPMLGLYTGARVTEIAQLYVEDVTQEDNIWGIIINDRFYGQKLKNKPSRRFIPLAKQILDAGFLDYVEEVKKMGLVRLFPHLPAGMKTGTKELNGAGYGRQLSRQFGEYLKKLNVEKGVAFHAFRHLLATKLDRAQKTEKQIARITGHWIKGSVLLRHYIDKQTLPERVETLKAFTTSVSFPAYTTGQFSQSLSDKTKLHK